MYMFAQPETQNVACDIGKTIILSGDYRPVVFSCISYKYSWEPEA